MQNRWWLGSTDDVVIATRWGDLWSDGPNTISPQTAAWRVDEWFPKEGMTVASQRAFEGICRDLEGTAPQPRDHAHMKERIRQALRDGRLVAFRSGTPLGGRPVPAPPAPPPTPPKPKAKVWVKLKFLDDLAGQPVGGVSTEVTLPDGSKADFTSGANGMPDGTIAILGIDPGSVDAACDLKNAKLPSTLAFMGDGEAPGGKKAPDDEPIPKGHYIVAAIEAHKVKKGETLDSIAAKAGTTAQNLAVFNFGTSETAAVNNAIRVRLGSKTLAEDKKTFLFGDDDKPGILYVPKEWKEAGLATEKTHALRLRPVVPRWLAITKVDPHFAPQAESLDIKYSISGLSKRTVKLQIATDKYDGKTLFEAELKAPEKADGEDKPYTWDGKITVGGKAGQFATPAMKPFKVKLFADATYADEAEFKILVHSLELKIGDFEKGVFDDDATTTKGQQERLKQLGYYHGDINGTAGDAKFKKAVELFQSEHDATAATKGTVGASTRDAIKARSAYCLDAGALPGDGAKAKVFVSGAFFYATDADLNPGGHPRYTDEQTFWGDGIKIPIYTKIYLKKKDGSKADAPKAVGDTKVLFEWIDPADEAVLTGKQKDYCDKALDYYKATTTPKGDNCHVDRGGKRGADIVKVFPENTDTTKFPFKVAKATKRAATVLATAREDDDALRGYAGVVFRPSRMGGDGYILHAYLHSEKDLDTEAEKATAPDVEVKTGSMYVWRRVRVNQYLHKPNPAINAISMATVNTEMAKAYMEFTGELASKDISQVKWEATVTAALTSDPDFATIGDVSYASLNTIDFKSFAAYQTAGGALNAGAYTALCRGKISSWLTRIMSEFAKDQYHGMTVMRVANGHSAYFTNSGLAPIGQACYVWWPKATYDAKSYVVEKYAAHEMGHCLYLRHHYTAGPTVGASVAGWPASDNPNDHDLDDAACAMSYFQTSWHLCGKCILKLRGWDEATLSNNDDANRKV